MLLILTSHTESYGHICSCNSFSASSWSLLSGFSCFTLRSGLEKWNLTVDVPDGILLRFGIVAEGSTGDQIWATAGALVESGTLEDFMFSFFFYFFLTEFLGEWSRASISSTIDGSKISSEHLFEQSVVTFWRETKWFNFNLTVEVDELRFNQLNNPYKSSWRAYLKINSALDPNLGEHEGVSRLVCGGRFFKSNESSRSGTTVDDHASKTRALLRCFCFSHFR